jgi:hypothetical protein
MYFRDCKTLSVFTSGELRQQKHACQCSVSLTQYREQYVNSLGLLILIPSQSMIVLTLWCSVVNIEAGLIKIKMLNRNIFITKSNNKNLVFIMLSACHKLKRFWKNNYIQLQTVGTCTCMHNKIFVWLKKNQWHLLSWGERCLFILLIYLVELLTHQASLFKLSFYKNDFYIVHL